MVTAEPALTPGERLPLSRERVLRTAVAIADEHGIEAVTMRRVGDELGAEAMSLYHHVANKNDLLDGVVDLVAEEINDVVDASGHDRAVAARRPRADPGRPAGAAPAPLGSGAAGHPLDAQPERRDATTTGSSGLLHDGGFSYDLAHHALHALGSRALGFSQELFDPGAGASAGPLPAGAGGRGAVARRDAVRGRARRPGLDPGLVRRPDGVRVRARPPARRAGRGGGRPLDQPYVVSHSGLQRKEAP